MSETTIDIGIERFISTLSRGLAKPNKFLVEFKLPEGIGEMKEGVNNSSTRGQISSLDTIYNQNSAINIYCHTCSLPQRSLLTYVHKQTSAPYRVPYSVAEYDPITFSFYSDGELNTRKYFDIWQNAVMNTKSNTVNYWNEFTSDITIKIIDEIGNIGYTVKLSQCYPVSVGMVELSYSMSNMLLSTMVTMCYRSWEEVDHLK